MNSNLPLGRFTYFINYLPYVILNAFCIIVDERLLLLHTYLSVCRYVCPLIIPSLTIQVCRSIVNARYDAQLRNAQTGKERKVKFRTIHKLLGLVSYIGNKNLK